MEVTITDKGLEYLQKLNEELDTTKSIRDEIRYPDYIILFHLDREGPSNLEEFLTKHSWHKDHPDLLKNSVRRLFEARYIESY